MSRVIVQVNLLSGRYHAHPWGEAQHAMAGPEWPPSPWRLLRALAAAWFDAIPRPLTVARRDELLQTLGRARPPTMWLPPVSFAEIPYYQPVFDKGKAKVVAAVRHQPVLHYDHFAVLSEGDEGACFCYEYELNLPQKQRSDLAVLLARMTYFGRTESRARLSLVDTPAPGLTRLMPTGDRSSFEHRRRRVLVPRHPFRSSDLWADEHTGGHLVQAMIRERQRLPPNTEWIDYVFPEGLILSSLNRVRSAPTERRPRVAAVQFGMFRRVPIHAPELVLIAREIRDQAVRRFKAATGETSVRLTGRDTDGSVARGHLHAFWLPEPDEETGRLESCTVWLPDGATGIDPEELDALLGVQRILMRDDYPVLVVPERVFEQWPEPIPSRHWRSLTPFLASRQTRRGRREMKPADQLRRMVEESTGAVPHVTQTSGPRSLGKFTSVRTHLYSHGQWRWTRRSAAWFDLEFDHPVVLPRPFGTDAHFGLGRFLSA